jgi:hypothetical protein
VSISSFFNVGIQAAASFTEVIRTENLLGPGLLLVILQRFLI